jgi:hypothetical protein
MENKELTDILRKSSNAAWTLGLFAIIYVIISLWTVNLIHTLLYM